MSYVIHPTAGGGGSAAADDRNVTAGFDGTATFVVNANSAAQPGDMFDLRGTASAADGIYVVINRINATTFEVQPTPPFNFGVVPPGTFVALLPTPAGDNKQAATAITSFPTPNRISAAGALFQTNDVRVNDRVFVSNAAGANRGAFVVSQVLSETLVEVKSNPFALIPPAGATVEVELGKNQLRFIDEPAGTMAAARGAATMFQPNWGVATDYLGLLSIDGGAQPGIGAVRTFDAILVVNLIATGAVPTRLSAEDELWINRDAGQYTMLMWTEGTGVTPPGNEFRFGQRGSDRLSASNGCMFFGISPATTGDSAWRFQGFTGVNSLIYGCSVKVRTDLGPALVTKGTSEWLLFNYEGFGIGAYECVVDSVNAMGTEPFNILENVALNPSDTANLTVNVSAQGVVGASANTRITDILLSDDSFRPAYAGVFTVNTQFVDPREDYDLTTELFSVTGFGNDAKKLYTFDPVFISRGALGVVGNPIPGLTVQIFQVDETTTIETEIAGSPFTTNAQGKLSTGPVELLRQNDFDNFSHRLIVQGPSFRLLNQVITMTAPMLGDIPIDFLQPDFEGETAT